MAQGSAGAKAGLGTADVITAIDGKPASGVALNDLRERFKAAPGTKITLTVKGKSGERKADLTLADQV